MPKTSLTKLYTIKMVPVESSNKDFLNKTLLKSAQQQRPPMNVSTIKVVDTRPPFEFCNFDLNKNRQIAQDIFSKYWNNSQELTSALYNHYDTDGIEGLSSEEFEKAKKDLTSVIKEGMSKFWDKAIKALVKDGTEKVSYTDIQNKAKELEASDKPKLKKTIDKNAAS